jgi:hypothetical protein
MAALESYNRTVEQAVRAHDGSKLRRLLTLSSEKAAAAMQVYMLEGGSCPAPMQDPWSSLPIIVEHRHAAAAAINATNWVEAYAHLTNCIMEYVNNVLPKDDAWSLPLLYGLCTDLRVVAEQADKQLYEEGYKPRLLQDVERTLKKAFSITNGDRTNEGAASKRVGTLGVINQLFRVYFKINSLRLCHPLIRTVNAPGFIDFETSFPVAHRVTYRFYVGRLHLFEGQYDDAVQNLTYAAEKIPASKFKMNKKLVLMYLIPAKIMRGSLPSQKLLETYDMSCYLGIVKALRSGNLSLFDSALERHEYLFIHKGLYLVLQRMRLIVFRSLCKKVFRTRVAMKAERPNVMNLDDYRMGLRACGIDLPRNEAECIIANLIFNGYVKGYISHKLGFLVLSTKIPFPELQSVQPKQPI